MLLEMRRYAMLPDRMDDMHARMSGMLMPLFAVHNIPTPRAIWENRGDTSTLTWLVEWRDFEARQAGWARVGPAFVAARQAENTPEFVTRTTLTVLAPWPGSSIRFGENAACETAWHVQPRIGFGAEFMAVCQDEVFHAFRAAGASNMAGANLVFGALPQSFVLIGWPDAATRTAGMAEIMSRASGAVLSDALLGAGTTLGECGEWETLDRATYLRV